MSKTFQNATTARAELTTLESFAVNAIQTMTMLNRIFTDNYAFLIALASFSVAALLVLFFFARRKAAKLGPTPDEKKDLARINTVARQRTQAYMERFVDQGLNHDGFFRLDAKIPPALQAAANRFSVGGNAADGGDDEDETSLSSVIQRFQNRDDDGSNQSVALLIAVDDGANEKAGSRVLQAHLSAKRLSAALETAGFATCLLSTLGDTAPSQRSCAAVLKQMQLAKRKFRSALLYICGRVRRAALDKWPDDSEMLTDKGRNSLRVRGLEIGRAADNIFEVLLQPEDATAASSWADISILISRFVQCAPCNVRPTVLLNVVWEKDEDAAWARDQREQRGVATAATDPNGLITALHLAAPNGLLDGVSIIAVERVVTEAVSDKKKSGDVFCNAITDGIRNATGTAARSAALGLNMGPMPRTLAATAAFHCGVMSAATIAAHLVQKSASATADGLLMPPLGIRLHSCLPHPLALQAVSGPRGAQPPSMFAAEKLWAPAHEAIIRELTAPCDRAAAAVCVVDADGHPQSARLALGGAAWQSSLLSAFEDQVLVVDWENINATDPPSGSAEEWQQILQHAVDLMIGATRHFGARRSTTELMGHIVQTDDSKVCVLVLGWLGRGLQTSDVGVPRHVTEFVTSINEKAPGAKSRFRVVFDVARDFKVAAPAVTVVLEPCDVAAAKVIARVSGDGQALTSRAIADALIQIAGTKQRDAVIENAADPIAAAEAIFEGLLTPNQRSVARAIAAVCATLQLSSVPVNAFATWVAKALARCEPLSLCAALRPAEVQAEIGTLCRFGVTTLCFDVACARVSVSASFAKLVDASTNIEATRAGLAAFVAQAKPTEELWEIDGFFAIVMASVIPLTSADADLQSRPPTLLDIAASGTVLAELAAPDATGSSALIDFTRALQRAIPRHGEGSDATKALELVTEVEKHLSRALPVALDALPREAVFQLWNRASSRLRRALVDRIGQAQPQPILVEYKGDIDAEPLPHVVTAVCLATTVPAGDLHDGLLGRRLTNDVAPRAVTSVAMLGDPASDSQRLYAGATDGSLAVLELESGAWPSESLTSDALRSRYVDGPQRLVERAIRRGADSPHTAPVVAIFTQRFADGATRIITASRKDRVIAVWPNFDLTGTPEVVKVLPPPVAADEAPQPDAGDDAPPPLPKDRRLHFSATIAKATFDSAQLLADRLPDRFDHLRTGGLDFTATADDVKGDTVLLRSNNDNDNSINFQGQQSIGAAATFTWLHCDDASRTHGSATISFASTFALKRCQAVNERGQLGLLVGETSGHVSVMALCTSVEI